MVGTTIFELDLAFFDPSFLNFEFGEDRLCANECQPRDRNGGNRHS